MASSGYASTHRARSAKGKDMNPPGTHAHPSRTCSVYTFTWNPMPRWFYDSMHDPMLLWPVQSLPQVHPLQIASGGLPLGLREGLWTAVKERMVMDNDQIYRLACLFINVCNTLIYKCPDSKGWLMKKGKGHLPPFTLLSELYRFWD